MMNVHKLNEHHYTCKINICEIKDVSKKKPREIIDYLYNSSDEIKKFYDRYKDIDVAAMQLEDDKETILLALMKHNDTMEELKQDFEDMLEMCYIMNQLGHSLKNEAEIHLFALQEILCNENEYNNYNTNAAEKYNSYEDYMDSVFDSIDDIEKIKEERLFIKNSILYSSDSIDNFKWAYKKIEKIPGKIECFLENKRYYLAIAPSKKEDNKKIKSILSEADMKEEYFYRLVCLKERFQPLTNESINLLLEL